MYSLFLALVLYPEVQRRAQAELDSVVSRDRLPTYDDKPRLPYIEAIIQELTRWNMVTPLGAGFTPSVESCTKTQNKGVAHTPIGDDFYQGYFIPKGLWASFKVNRSRNQIHSLFGRRCSHS